MSFPEDTTDRGADDPLYPDDYYEFLEQQFGSGTSRLGSSPACRTRKGTGLDPRQLRHSGRS